MAPSRPPASALTAPSRIESPRTHPKRPAKSRRLALREKSHVPAPSKASPSVKPRSGATPIASTPALTTRAMALEGTSEGRQMDIPTEIEAKVARAKTTMPSASRWTLLPASISESLMASPLFDRGPVRLFPLLEGHQHLAGLAALVLAADAGFAHHVEQARGARVADAERPLQQARRAAA